MQLMLFGDLVMIFVGYLIQMVDFVKLNLGFNCRIRIIFCFFDYFCEELVQMFLNMMLERGFIIEVSFEEIKGFIEKLINEVFRKQWNVGVSEKIFRLVKEYFDERLVLDFFGLVVEKCDIVKFNKEDICSVIELFSQD